MTTACYSIKEALNIYNAGIIKKKDYTVHNEIVMKKIEKRENKLNSDKSLAF